MNILTFLTETCDPNPCMNGGTCDVSFDGETGDALAPYCQCPSGYSGSRCEIGKIMKFIKTKQK